VEYLQSKTKDPYDQHNLQSQWNNTFKAGGEDEDSYRSLNIGEKDVKKHQFFSNSPKLFLW
jgi:hypothetical protein